MFIALTLTRDLAVAVHPLTLAIRAHDPDLADQLRRAVTSVVLNTAEGVGRRGRDRAARYRIATGECHELTAGLELAAALGHVPADATAPALRLADRVRALLYRLQHPRA